MTRMFSISTLRVEGRSKSYPELLSTFMPHSSPFLSVRSGFVLEPYGPANSTARKGKSTAYRKLPEAPPPHALLPLTSQPGENNVLLLTSTGSPSQPAEPASPKVLCHPPSSNSRSHSPIPLKAIPPAGAKALSILLDRPYWICKSQWTVGLRAEGGGTLTLMNSPVFACS